MKNRRIKAVLLIIGSLIVLQLSLFIIKQIIFIIVERTNYTDHIASMIGMIILSILFVFFAKKQKVALSVFPERFNKFYILETCIAAVLFVVTPSNYSGGFQAIMLLLYGSIVTPIFEELIFRGYIWDRLNSIFDKELVAYIVSTVLFALWHLGYIDSLAFRTETGLASVMLWKAIIGLCYGIVLGALRLKTKNSYSTMLLHGVMNIFGR